MVQAVNNLRRLGKGKALEALQIYLGENNDFTASEQNEKVLLICRLLFVNPQGWRYPRLGQPYPDVIESAYDKNPIFPLVLSHGIPFLLIAGYQATGYTSDTADKCVKLCEAFSVISDDLPEKGYEEAARALVESDAFQNLYSDPKVLIYVKKMILDEAQCLDPTTRSGGNVQSTLDIKIGNESH